MKLIVLTLSLLVTLSCNQNRKFDKYAWSEKGDLGICPNRDEMLKDLLNNHQLKGLTYKQLVELLGEPKNNSDAEQNVAYYNVVTDYGRDIDPVYVKNLQVKFNSDSIVTDVGISESTTKRRTATANRRLPIYRRSYNHSAFALY